jgi:hypothetical protein
MFNLKNSLDTCEIFEEDFMKIEKNIIDNYVDYIIWMKLEIDFFQTLRNELDGLYYAIKL